MKMTRLTLRNLLCIAMIPLMPCSLLAAEPSGAMMYVSGSTSVNGAAITHSLVVFPGDIIETANSSQANINTAGASVTIFEDSRVKFERSGIFVEDGSVNIGAYKKDLSTTAGSITVTPASNTWTEFQMIYLNGRVQIFARKGDVNVTEGTETVTLPEGQTATRGDSTTGDDSNNKEKKRKKKNEGATPAARAPVLDSPIVIGVGAGAITAGLIYVLTRSGSPVSPVSP
jgi:hypothetical protein